MDLELVQRDAARVIGASEAALLMWEKGRSSPEIRFWPAILSFLSYEPWQQPQSLPERLLAFRRSRGWSQTRLAEELGTIQGVVGSWESGEHRPIRRFRSKLDELFRDQETKSR